MQHSFFLHSTPHRAATRYFNSYAVKPHPTISHLVNNGLQEATTEPLCTAKLKRCVEEPSATRVVRTIVSTSVVAGTDVRIPLYMGTLTTGEVQPLVTGLEKGIPCILQ